MTSITGAIARTNAPAPSGSEAAPPPLEPDHALPTAPGYRPSVAGWIGTALGTVGGGLGGAALGGIAGVILGAGIHESATLGRAGLVLGAIAGTLAGGIATYSFNRTTHDTKANDRIQAEHGTSTLDFARGMMANFDHDDNGQIDLVNSTGLASQDERVFTEERRQSRTHPHYDLFRDEWRTEVERWTESRGTSAGAVWNAADADGDDVVTDVELGTLMSTFDADRNGALTTPEQEAFRSAHPVLVEEWNR